MATMVIKNGSGADETVEKPLAPGRAAANASRPVTLSTEDKAALDAIATTATPAGTAVIGRVGIDQTTDGTTNLVAAKQNGTWVMGTVTPGTAATNLGKAEDAVHASGDVGVMALAVQIASPADAAGNGDYAALQVSGGRLNVTASKIVTLTASITRPADTAAYAVGDAFANSTTAPTEGGGTLTGVTAISGGSAILTDVVVTSSAAPATPLVGEIWLFDTAPTAINDNAAFAVSDAEVLTLVDIVPFGLTTVGNNSMAVVQRGTGITTVGSANLRFLVRVANAYTPASGEVLTIRAKFRMVQ